MGLPSACNLIFFCVFYDSVREHGQSHHAYPGTAVCDGLFCRCAVQQLQQQQPVQQQQQLEHEQQKHEQQQLQQHEQQQQLEQQPELEHEQQQQLEVERRQPRHVWQQLQQQQPVQQPVRKQPVRHVQQQGRPAILRLQQIQLFQHPVAERLRGQPPLRLRQRAVHDLLQGHQEHPKKKDRMFQVGCGGANAAQNCTWSEWMNDINADFFYQCPDNKVMTGMSSMANPNRNSNDNRMQGSDGENSNVFNNNNNYRETGWQDRQFKSACCMVHNKPPVNCRLSDWVNNWNEFFTWWTRHASVINGVYSEYSPAVRDRRWKFVYCDLM